MPGGSVQRRGVLGGSAQRGVLRGSAQRRGMLGRYNGPAEGPHYLCCQWGHQSTGCPPVDLLRASSQCCLSLLLLDCPARRICKIKLRNDEGRLNILNVRPGCPARRVCTMRSRNDKGRSNTLTLRPGCHARHVCKMRSRND